VVLSRAALHWGIAALRDLQHDRSFRCSTTTDTTCLSH
jgi:hypothetical protein